MIYWELDILGALTYLIEAFCFEYEHRVGGTMVQSKVRFVSIFSLVLGILVASRPGLNYQEKYMP